MTIKGIPLTICSEFGFRAYSNYKHVLDTHNIYTTNIDTQLISIISYFYSPSHLSVLSGGFCTLWNYFLLRNCSSCWSENHYRWIPCVDYSFNSGVVLLDFNWQLLATKYSSCTKKPIFTLSNDNWKTDCSLSLNAFVSCNACASLPVFLLLITTLYPQFNSLILCFHFAPLSTHQWCLCSSLSPSLIFLQGFERNVKGLSTLKITVHPRFHLHIVWIVLFHT